MIKKKIQCKFCQFIKSKKNKFFENELFFVFYDSYPVSPGHVCIIPKRHLADFRELNLKEWLELRGLINKTINLIRKTDWVDVYKKIIKEPISNKSLKFCRKALAHPKINKKPDAYNQGINDGRAAGRTIDHFHWHIIPRYKDDVKDPVGGIRNIIPKMGNYLE